MAPTVGRHDWDAGLLGGIGTVTEYLPLARQGGNETRLPAVPSFLYHPLWATEERICISRE